jgi:uncharacterized membrane protein YeaQ/YmgE (transglycosylase-associated protein family)
MSDITISRSEQGLLLLAILGVIGAAVAAQIPELQRYLKIRSM